MDIRVSSLYRIETIISYILYGIKSDQFFQSRTISCSDCAHGYLREDKVLRTDSCFMTPYSNIRSDDNSMSIRYTAAYQQIKAYRLYLLIRLVI